MSEQIEKQLDCDEFSFTEPTPTELLFEMALDSSRIVNTCPLVSIAAAASLFYQPSLQSNTLRIEATVHLISSLANGHVIDCQGLIADVFDALEGTSLRILEDPSECVMSAPVVFGNESHLILNGIWEHNSFILQRVLDVVSTMPSSGGFEELKECVSSFLRVASACCRRSGLTRYEIGADSPADQINSIDLIHPEYASFSLDDLADWGVNPKWLKSFIVCNDALKSQQEYPVSHSLLHRFPIVQSGDNFVLAMPCSVPIAIREFLVEMAVGNDLVSEFAAALKLGVRNLLLSERVFGLPPDYPLRFSKTPEGWITEFANVSNSGEVIHLVFLVDDLREIENTKTVGRFPLGSNAEKNIEDRINRCISGIRNPERHNVGLTLIVNCGIGRKLELGIPEVKAKDWQVDSCSLEDLVHMNRLIDFDPFDLIRISRGVTKATELGVRLDNPHGIANLVAWVRSNKGHVVPSDRLPQECRINEFTIGIAPSYIRELRAESSQINDIVSVPNIDGEHVLVRRCLNPLFPKPLLLATYSPIDLDPYNGSVVFFYNDHTWWFILPTDNPSVLTFERLEMLRTWITRVIVAVSRFMELGQGQSTELQFLFTDDSHKFAFRAPTKIPMIGEIENDISVTWDADKRSACIIVGKAFEDGTTAPTNISERALVRKIVVAIAGLPGVSIQSSEVDFLIDEIVVSPDARHVHGFTEQSYHDRFVPLLKGEPIEGSALDNCNLRLGLAFRVEPRTHGRKKLRSKRTCTKLLNDVVKSLEDELCERLRLFNLNSVATKILTNYEAALYNRERWQRTAHANVALHSDTPATMRRLVDRIGGLDATTQGSRLLLEVAIHECRKIGGYELGDSDLSELLNLVGGICVLGGWSDAIHFDAMPAELEITPLGDILADTTFERQILMPFHGHATSVRVQTSIDDREELYGWPKNDHEPASFSNDFLDSILAELGVNLETVVNFANQIEVLGYSRNALVFLIPEEEIVRELLPSLGAQSAKQLVDSFTLRQRTSWRQLPPNHAERDIQLWRFRRMLSLMRRPILEIDDGVLMISPDLISSAIMHVLRSYYEGDYRHCDLATKKMQTWNSKANQKRGSSFAVKVENTFATLGWTTFLEHKVKEILGMKTDQDYGDVDVLAYHRASGRVLCIECKSLHFHKTHGEVAEQLSDYRGKIKPNGKGDELRKHLNRIEVLKQHQERLARFVGSMTDITIEALLVFENPVPMIFAWSGLLQQSEVAVFTELVQRYDMNERREVSNRN